MTESRSTEIWDLWIQDVGSQGISFARGWMNATEVLWVHAAPSLLRVEVSTRTPSRVDTSTLSRLGAAWTHRTSVAFIQPRANEIPCEPTSWIHRSHISVDRDSVIRRHPPF